MKIVYTKPLAEQGIRQSNPIAVIGTAKERADEANRKTQELQKQVGSIDSVE